MKILVVGGGRLSRGLVDMLSEERNDVVVIEKDRKRAERLAEEVNALVLHGDGLKESVLIEGGVEDSDVLVAMTGEDDTNLMICNAAKAHGVSRILARISNPSNEHRFRDFIPVNSVSEAVLAFRKHMDRPGRQAAGVVAGGKAAVSEVVVGEALAGKKAREIEDGFSVSLIFRKGKLLLPDETLKKNDVLVLCYPLRNSKKVDRVFL